MCLLGPSRAAGATQGLQSWERWGYFQYLLSPACGPSIPQPSSWPLHSSAPRTLPDQQPAQHLHTFFTPPISHMLLDLTGALITSKTAQAQAPFLPLTLLVLQGKELFHHMLCHYRTCPTILGASLTYLMSTHTGQVPVKSHVTGLDSHHIKQGPAPSQKGCPAAGAGSQWSMAGILGTHPPAHPSRFPLGTNQVRKAGKACRALLHCIFPLIHSRNRRGQNK